MKNLSELKITFFSNFLNHHQTPFCDEMYKILKNKFTFVSTIKIPDLFLHNGYSDCSNYSYNLNAYLNEKEYERALLLGLESDVVIIGASSDVFIRERLRQGKLVFRYSERIFKNSFLQLFNPSFLYSMYKYHTKYRFKENLFVLCASAFAANDFNKVFAYPKRKYKWGYFTEIKDINIEYVISGKSTSKIELIWVARFISWKHPELVVRLAHELKKSGYNFHIRMFGAGVLVETIMKLIVKLNVSDCISLQGSVSNAHIREYMLKANIFLFTSDRNEGWGAVLNEAMSSGCAVVASNSIGAVPFLIESGRNGLIFKSGDLKSLFKATRSLMDNKQLRARFGINAYNTMRTLWNPQCAANNFIKLANSLLSGEKIVFKIGPCSPAVNNY